MRAGGKRGKHPESPEARRIESILRCLTIMFESDGLVPEPDAANEYASLLGFAKNPSREKALRIDSVLRAQEALFGAGLVDRDESYAEELEKLRRWAAALVPLRPRSVRGSAILPRNLGYAFVRKRLGLPLFGPYRPREVPSGRGVVVRYKSAAAYGPMALSATRLDERTEIVYRGLGAEIRSAAPWARCVLARAEDAPFMDLRAEIGIGAEPVVFEFESRTAFLAARTTKDKQGDRFEDPYAYRYAYFFPDDDRLKMNLARFLRDLFTGMYGIVEAETLPLVSAFIERSL